VKNIIDIKHTSMKDKKEPLIPQHDSHAIIGLDLERESQPYETKEQEEDAAY